MPLYMIKGIIPFFEVLLGFKIKGKEGGLDLF